MSTSQLAEVPFVRCPLLWSAERSGLGLTAGVELKIHEGRRRGAFIFQEERFHAHDQGSGFLAPDHAGRRPGDRIGVPCRQQERTPAVLLETWSCRSWALRSWPSVAFDSRRPQAMI